MNDSTATYVSSNTSALYLATKGSKVAELQGTEREYRQLGLDTSNLIAAMDIVAKSTHEKKGYVMGYLAKVNKSNNIRRGVLEALYKPAK